MPKRTRLAAAALAAVTLAAPTLANADCKLLLLAEFKLDPKSYAPVADGAINARAIKVLVDSGATFSGVSSFAVNRLGLPTIEMVGMRAYGIGGDTQVFRAHINELKIGSYTKTGLDLFVSGDDSRAGPAELILGEDVLSKVDTEFDLAHNAIRLFEPKGCTAPQLVYWGAAYSQADLLTWDPEQPAIQTHAYINGKQILAELDSGAEQSVVDATAADADGVSRPPTAAGAETIHGMGREAVQSWTGRFDSFAIGDEKISHVSVQVLPFTHGMTYTETGDHTPRQLANTPSMFIGDDFLHSHRVFIDNQDHLILFSYQGGPVFNTPPPAAAK
ncbi:MAG TPA: retroviral-like aspartic protease family protein [Caulobacteraceae bacterium]|nr:retroviral-like aspartic protease family protein [Caulobacteraceae bacterium]